MLDHERHMARVKELSRRSANGEFGMHEHTPVEACTPDCPEYDPAFACICKHYLVDDECPAIVHDPARSSHGAIQEGDDGR